jgi:hypothetical protein
LSVFSSKAQLCSSVRQRPIQVMGPASTSRGSMKMLSSRCGSISAQAWIPSSVGTWKTGYSSPWYVNVSGSAG